MGAVVQGGSRQSHRQVLVRMVRCSCSLSSVVTVFIVVQTVCWTILAISAVIIVIHPHSAMLPLTSLTGLSYIRLSITILGVSFLGILSNILLLTGIRTDIRYLLIPWVVTNTILTLGMFTIGTYFLILFTMVKKRKDIVLAAISVVPIIISILMFIITIFVIKLFIKMKQKQLLVRVASSFRGSRASLNYRTRGTPRSMRSRTSCGDYEQPIRNTNNSQNSIQSYKTPNSGLYFMHKSKSLEYILDSSTDESVYKEKYTKSLQRIPKRKESDTMRSNKSVASAKSVSIYPRVIEYHYSDGKDALTDKSDKKDVMEDVVNSDYSEGSVPPPIFPKHGHSFSQQNMSYYQDFVL